MTARLDNLERFRDTSPEQKLAILRSEMITPIATIRGLASILKQQVTPEIAEGLPDEFGNWIDSIIEAGDDLKKILETLTA